METGILKTIGKDIKVRKELEAYFIKTLLELAGSDALQGKETGGYKEAKNCINRSLDKLALEHSEKKSGYTNQSV
jgi:hypothetical protein